MHKMHTIKILYTVTQTLSLANSRDIYGPYRKSLHSSTLPTQIFLNYITTNIVISSL